MVLCLLKTDGGSVEPQPARNGIVVSLKLMFLTSDEIGKQIGWINSTKYENIENYYTIEI